MARVSVETNPRRKASVKVFYQNKEDFERRNASYACTTYMSQERGDLGLDRSWRWAAAAARTCGVRIPHKMDEGATPSGSAIHEVDEDGPKDEADQEPDDETTDDATK